MAADICCDTIIGGTFHLSIGDKRYEVIGEARIRPGYRERSAEATSSGRMWATERAVLTEADVTFGNFCDADPLEIFDGRCKISVTLVEESRGYRHMFTDAVAVGRPEINFATGQVTGISLRTDKYVRVIGAEGRHGGPDTVVGI